MASVSVYNMEGKETGKMELNDSIFAAPVNAVSYTHLTLPTTSRV